MYCNFFESRCLLQLALLPYKTFLFFQCFCVTCGKNAKWQNTNATQFEWRCFTCAV